MAFALGAVDGALSIWSGAAPPREVSGRAPEGASRAEAPRRGRRRRAGIGSGIGAGIGLRARQSPEEARGDGPERRAAPAAARPSGARTNARPVPAPRTLCAVRPPEDARRPGLRHPILWLCAWLNVEMLRRVAPPSRAGAPLALIRDGGLHVVAWSLGWSWAASMWSAETADAPAR